MFGKFVKLIWNSFLNNGVKEIHVTGVSVGVEGSQGTRNLGINSTITIETKKSLTPKERRRKNVIILLIISLIFMLTISTVGLLLPDAGLGRILVLLSEIPAFAFSLTSTEFLRRKKKNVLTSQ